MHCENKRMVLFTGLNSCLEADYLLNITYWKLEKASKCIP